MFGSRGMGVGGVGLCCHENEKHRGVVDGAGVQEWVSVNHRTHILLGLTHGCSPKNKWVMGKELRPGSRAGLSSGETL